MRPEFTVAIPEAVMAFIGSLAVIIASLALYKDLYWQNYAEETSYFQPYLTLIEENSGEYELSLFFRDIFYQVVVIVFTAPTVFHLILHIILTLNYKYDDDNEESGLETPEEDPDYLFGETPELVFPSPNHIHSYELIKLESQEALQLLKEETALESQQSAMRKFTGSMKQGKPRYNVQSLTKKMSKANLARLAEITNQQTEKTRHKTKTKSRSLSADAIRNGSDGGSTIKRKSNGKAEAAVKDGSKTVVQRKKPESAKVRISAELPESSDAQKKEETDGVDKPDGQTGGSEDKGIGDLSWFLSRSSLITERPLDGSLTTTRDRASTIPFTDDALQRNVDYFLMEETEFLDSRMCKLILLASIIFESLVAFAAAYYQYKAANEFQEYYKHPNVTSRAVSRSSDLRIAAFMLKSCADLEWETKLKELPKGDSLFNKRNEIYVCQDTRGKFWTGTMCILLGISGFITIGVIYWEFGEILAFRDGGNYQNYQRWRKQQLIAKRRYALARDYEPSGSWSSSPSHSIDSVDPVQRYERNIRLDSGEERLFNQYTVDF